MFDPAMEASYHAVPLEEEQQTSETKSLLTAWEKYANFIPLPSESSKHSYLIWMCHGLLLSFSLALFLLSLLANASQPAVCECPQLEVPYSPAQSVSSYRTIRYNITPALDRTEFVGHGLEVDKAWNHITYDVGDQMISREELDQLGLDPESLTVKDPKTSQQGYRVGIQVFHQLHCLNLLRQETYKEYYSHMGGDIEVDREDLRGHLDHCVEVLRTNLMCQSDIGVFTFKYYDGFEGHWPDFSTLHTCRDFDAIRDWAFQHAVAFGNEE